MKHLASPAFWSCYNRLPSEMQQLADRSFGLLKADPRHPSLRLKKVGKYWSVRIGRRHRGLAIHEEDTLIWFWIGTHAEYDRLIGQ